ncbi:HNH endonuclease [Nocardiopsis quinghaiensis]|uniref:HNH endonuclease n=1 Tax=Nocardiopsis quinghaiensis TaxID=464995 RepID=UPI001238A874|nr:HNH endonuclease [Nocardiopsis quinghaiensis]
MSTHERFMSRVDTSGDCWVWTKSLARNGYGSFRVDGKTYSAPRWMLEYHLGRALEEDEVVRHTCHNKACVNPDHLVPGTHADNMRDMSEAKRGRRGPHADCDHEGTKRARYLCRKANGTKQPYTRGPSDYDRFMSYADTSGGDDSCWLWLRYKDRGGYGEFDVTRNGRQKKYKATRWIMSHTLSRELERGEIVMHVVCDHPPCVNPRHLRVGTHAENMEDMRAKKRFRNGSS